MLAALPCFSFGVFGAHRFSVGKVSTGTVRPHLSFLPSSPVPVVLELEPQRPQLIQTAAIEGRWWWWLLGSTGKDKGKDYPVTGISAPVPDGKGQLELSPLGNTEAHATGATENEISPQLLPVLLLDARIAGRIRPMTYLLEDANKSSHIPIRVLGCHVNPPGITVVELLGGKPVGNDGRVSAPLRERVIQRLGVSNLPGKSEKRLLEKQQLRFSSCGSPFYPSYHLITL